MAGAVAHLLELDEGAAEILGSRKSTGLPWAPIFGSPLPSTRAPVAIRASRAARMSSTS